LEKSWYNHLGHPLHVFVRNTARRENAEHLISEIGTIEIIPRQTTPLSVYYRLVVFTRRSQCIGNTRHSLNFLCPWQPLTHAIHSDPQGVKRILHFDDLRRFSAHLDLNIPHNKTMFLTESVEATKTFMFNALFQNISWFSKCSIPDEVIFQFT
jgi:hypothetical protein